LTKRPPSAVDSPALGSLIAYSVRAGAEVIEEQENPFTTALLEHLVVPGRDIRLALGFVRSHVIAATQGKQEPFIFGSFGSPAISLKRSTSRGFASEISRPHVDRVIDTEETFLRRRNNEDVR
jgi:hypothetical protein